MIGLPSETLSRSALFLLGLLLVKRFISSRRGAPLPPGPKGWPIIGNIFDFPQGKQWVEYARWGEKWGALIYMNLFGQSVIIVNDADTVVDMLDKKSAKYSDRPVFLVASEIAGYGQGLALDRYGDRLREGRRMIHRYMGTRSSMEKFRGTEELETHRLLRRILKRPEAEYLQEHIRSTAGAIILMISHGYTAKKNDPFIALADQQISNFAALVDPGRFLADTFHILQYVPDWCPGTAWKRTAKEFREVLHRSVDLPHEFVKDQIRAGTAIPSFTSMYLADGKLSKDHEEILKWTSSSLMGGGSDTIICASYTFFLAMVLHPEIQKKAQEELDAVMGDSRLPTLDDRSELPYVEAILKEVLRWNPIAPLGVPHRLSEDDVHDGYFIPKGSVILPNIWKFLHDEETYKDPFEFRPERFIASKDHEPERDPRDFTFGFGRRICPGQLLADSSLFISCAMVLSVFNILKTVEDGVEITPKEEFVDELVSHPKPFKCTIKPRSEQAVSLINSVELESE